MLADRLRCFAFAAGLAFAGYVPAQAACKARMSDDTEASLTNALLKRLRPLGVRDISRVSSEGWTDHYVLVSAKPSLFLTTDDGMVTEAAVALSTPFGAADAQKQLITASFILARISGQAEISVQDMLHRSIVAHPSGAWVERFGDALASLSQSGDGIGIRMARYDCN